MSSTDKPAQHTAGPWQLGYCAEGPDRAHQVVIAPNSGEELPPELVPVAKVYGPGSGFYMHNARLIAAAPDMLAALREALRCMEAVNRNTPCWGRAAIGDVRAAIALATEG